MAQDILSLPKVTDISDTSKSTASIPLGAGEVFTSEGGHV
jgi:hypothetical protein